MTQSHNRGVRVREDSPSKEKARAERLEAKNRWIWKRAWELDRLSWTHENPPKDWVPNLKRLRKIADSYKEHENEQRKIKQRIISTQGYSAWLQHQISEMLDELEYWPRHPIHYERRDRIKARIKDLEGQLKSENSP